MPRQVTLAIAIALLGIARSAAQDSSATSTAQETPAPNAKSQTQASRESGNAKKQKKVWTNDNLGEANGTVSLVGNGEVGTATGAKATKTDASYAAVLRKQLRRLQMQLNDTNKRIEQLNSFNKGESGGSAGMQLHKAYSMESIPDQIRKLQERKKQLEAAIDALLDDARKRAIEPGQLR